jgi:2-oxoglutarate ferredoxin oxidoreductase subunit alpha
MTFDKQESHLALVDGSRLIAESCVRAGAEAFVGYPITPASLIYTFSSRRFPMVLPAPDEISSLQWMAGLSAAGRLPVTATSFPGLALMIESINMAFMMELPMLIILVQRLGPALGTATTGAQGDLSMVYGLVSGGHALPVFCPSSINDCWRLPPIALQTAVDLRTPVVLLTSKEMVLTEHSFDLGELEQINPVQRKFYAESSPYQPYAARDDLAPAFLPVGDSQHQVRFTASTHNASGILRHSGDSEALANTRRLEEKTRASVPVLYELDEQDGAETLLMAYGVTSLAAREAAATLRAQGVPVSLCAPRTLLPLPPVYYEIIERYPRIVVAEENVQAQLARLLFGQQLPHKVRAVTGIGQMISPAQIIREVKNQ